MGEVVGITAGVEDLDVADGCAVKRKECLAAEWLCKDAVGDGRVFDSEQGRAIAAVDRPVNEPPGGFGVDEL